MSGGSEDGVDGIALGVGEIVAAHAMFILDVADERLDGGAASHLAFDGGCHSAFLARGVNLEPVAFRRVVAAISGISK